MNTRTIRVGKRNSVYQRIVALKENRNKRYSCKEFFVEGVHNIKSALKFGWTINHWIYSQKKLSTWAKNIIETYHTKENYCLSDELINEISTRNNKSEIMAIIEMKDTQISHKECPFIVLCDRISKKGNLGTIIRSADAFGCDGIIVSGHSVDIYDPEVIVATMGSFFATNVVKMDDNNIILEYINNLKAKYPDLKLIATTELGKKNIREYDFTQPIILLVGNETYGLSKFYMELADDTVKIPMVGEATSYNVANATSIFMYEIFEQRNKKL